MLFVATVVIVFAVYRLARAIHRERGRRSGAVTAADDVGRPPSEWLAAAAAHEACGEWNDAVRCRYRALVAELAVRGLLEEVPGRTSGEYRRLLADALPVGAPPFSTASDVFDRAWYGFRSADAVDAETVRTAADTVMRVAA